MPRLGQQFGAVAGDALRTALPDWEVQDLLPGPDGWSPDIDVLLAGPTKFWRSCERPAHWPGRTSWIQLPSTGTDGYPAWMFEVPCVAAAPGLHAGVIAEYVLACMLAFEKRMPQVWCDAPGKWRPHPVGTLRGRTLALAGVGAIGSAVATLAQPFGMRIVGLRRTGAAMEGVEIVKEPLELAAAADHLVLCMPASVETRRFVDAQFLAACRPGVHLVNVARGELIDQDALLHALDNGTVARASLDVTTPEPLPAGHALYAHPNVRLTPHVAWNAPDGIERLVGFFLNQFQRYAQGHPPRHAVTPH